MNMRCPNYYPLVSMTTSDSLNPCFIAALLIVVSAVSMIVSAVQLSQIRYKVGSIHKQSAHYKFRCAVMVVYNLSLISYLPFIVNRVFFYATLSNLLVNVICISPILILEVLYSIIPSGVVLYSTLIESIIFGVLSLQGFLHGDIPVERSQVTLIIQCITTISALAIFISELSFYKPSVELIRYRLANRLPIDLPNAVNKFTYSFMNEVVRNNFGNPNMKVSDLHEMVPPLISDINYGWLNAAWTEQFKYKNKSFLRAMFKCFGAKTLITLICYLAAVAMSYTQPQLFRLLIQSINDESITSTAKILLSVAMFLCATFRTIFTNATYQHCGIVGASVNGAMTRLLFNKAIRLAPESKNVKSTGDIINLITVDTGILENGFMDHLVFATTDPIEFLLAIGSLYYLLGNSMWVGLIIMIVVIPINSKIMKSMNFLQSRHLTRRDIRTSLISDILTSIKSIKLYSWEKPMLEKLDKARNDDELGDLVKKERYSSIARTIGNCVPYLICGSSFYLYSAYNDTPLTAAEIFPAISLFDMLKEPITYVADEIAAVLEMRIAAKRIEDFLLMAEVEPEERNNGSSLGIEIQNAKFLWSKVDHKVALENVNYKVSNGQLSCIVGRVGSGKSAFLKAILGELSIVSNDLIKPATFNINGSIAYCPQVPWIMNATVKQNILFNHEYDEAFYDVVLECCDLNKDISTFEEADETFVGEKGISLSGGQKARLSLARALYARADIYVLDDILSAVDSHVSAKLIAKVFNKKGGLLSNKTTILATNNVKVLSFADEITFLEDHTILESGTFNEVISQDKKLADLIKNFGSTVDESELESYESDQEFKIPTVILEKYDDDAILARLTNSEFGDKQEKSGFGKVKWSVYIAYFKACGFISILATMCVVILASCVDFADNYWLKYWGEINAKAGKNVSAGYYISIFLLISTVISFLNCGRDYCFRAFLPIRAAKLLHHNMAHSVMRAPMQFFESTPIGRILNRFTGDIDSIDIRLARQFESLFTSLINVIFILFIISYNLPVFLMFFFLLSFVYRYYQVYYVSVSREIKRLLLINRSPVLSLVGESIGGDETIRAFDQLSIFDHYVSLLLDNSNKVKFNNFSFAKWVAVRLEFIGSLIVLIVAVLSVYTQQSSRPLSASLVALVLSYTLHITSSLQSVVRSTAICESQIVSVERILEYSNLPSEAPLIIESNRTAANWPDRGNIEFVNYSTSYKEGLSPVLKKLNFKINSKEKIGIVGRTGAGKSTLAAAVFRLLEPTSGFIKIDDVVTSDIGLYDLRHNLNIIPQDAQALQGTIRSNLDPLSSYTDAQLLNALKLSHFDKFLSDENILDYAVSESGSNLSVGQRQLLCLSRALLNPSKILILDEATAAVDVETDKIIQETIRTEFNDRTIITIAHRLDTILDYDKVLLLDEGEVKEFDKVDVLLKNKKSLFYKMCEKGGYS